MLFSSVSILALASYVFAAGEEEAFSELANIDPTDTAAQLAWLSNFATISGDPDLASLDASDIPFDFPTTLDSQQLSLLNEITAAAAGPVPATANVSDSSQVAMTSSAPSLNGNSTQVTAMTAAGNTRSGSGAGSGSGSRNSSSSAGSSSRSSSASGIAGKEAPMIFGAVLAGLSALML